MDKRELILNAMSELIAKDKGACSSVSDIAKCAGIGKGSIYYYFTSKEEIFDAVVDRYYSAIIFKCGEIADRLDLSPIEKLKHILQGYRSSNKSPPIDTYLHSEHNAAIHQKSLAKILLSLSPIIAKIIKQGIVEKTFKSDYPDEIAEIIMSVFAFLLDPGIFAWAAAQIVKKLDALTEIIEKSLQTEVGCFAFISQLYLR